jgi:phage-related tail protein
MPTRSTTTKRKSTAAKSGKDRAGADAMQRLQASIDAADTALQDLRRELGRGSRDLLTDVERTLKDARKNVRRASRAVARDLEQVQKAAAGQRKRRRPAAARKGARGAARSSS